MWPVVAAIGAGAIGSWFGQESANSANRNLMNANQEWQERMSNTAHQREVNDLREAGLNPILSAHKGASTPAGNLAKMENTIAPAVNSAIDGMNLMNSMKQTNSTVALQEAQGAAAAAQANLSNTSAKRNEVETEVLGYQKGAIKSEAELRRKQADIDQKYQKYDNTTRRIQQGLGIVNSAKDAIMPSIKIKGGDRVPRNHGLYNKKTGEIYP